MALAAARARRARLRRLLELVPRFPTAVWGGDDFGTGDKWNSNS